MIRHAKKPGSAYRAGITYLQGDSSMKPWIHRIAIAFACLGFASVLPVGVGAQPPPYITQWGTNGSGNGQFQNPYGLATDAAGNVYVSDQNNSRIQKFTSTGTFITKWGMPGSGNGEFDKPRGVATDAAGNVYVADAYNHRIQKFTSTGVYITQWGALGTGNGQFSSPAAVATDTAGNVYVSDVDESILRIQKFTSTGVYLTQWGTYGSGDGQFKAPYGLATDAAGNVYVSDSFIFNPRIQKFTNTGTFITKWGTPGTGNGQFDNPGGVATDAAGNVYVADANNHRIEKFTSTGVYITQWGTPGSGNGQFNFPGGVATDVAGNIYVADRNNHRIQKFVGLVLAETHVNVTCYGASTGSIDLTVSGGTLPYKYLWSPGGETTEDLSGLVAGTYTVAVTDFQNATVTRSVTITQPPALSLSETQVNVPCLGDSMGAIDLHVSGCGQPFSYMWSPGGETTEDLSGLAAGVYVVVVTDANSVSDTRQVTIGVVPVGSTYRYITQWGTYGSSDGEFSSPTGVATDVAGNVYVADQNNSRIQKFTSTGTYITQWGTPGSGNGQFDSPRGVATDAAGNVYVADTYNQRVQKFTSTGTYITQWGSFGSGDGQFYLPRSVATDAAGDVYVADTNNYRIQKFTGAGTYITQWGSVGSGDGQFLFPESVAADPAGNVYVSDGANNRIQKFTSAGTYITQWGGFDYGPLGVATDGAGNVYVAETGDRRIQKFTSTGIYITQWGTPGSGLSGPRGVAIDAVGDVYVSDFGDNRIQKFHPTALTAAHVDVLGCYGDATGLIDLTVEPGGTGPLSYLWSPGGETTEDVSGLPAGAYVVLVKDAHGCVDSLSVTISQPDSLTLTATSVSCDGGTTGSIYLWVSGGTPQYSYLWSPGGATSQDLSGLVAGTYTVVVTDTNGCADSLSVIVVPATVYMIIATASPGGTISPSDTVLVPCGGDTTFTFAPDPGYGVLDVNVDGSSQGNPLSYVFTNVGANHTIHVKFDQSVATLLSLFSANPVAGGIELRWRLGDPQAFAHVVLDRAEAVEGPWTRVTGAMRAEGEVTVVLDEGLTAGVTYTYRLRATTRNGRDVELGQLTGTAGERITAFALAPVWPNPARGTANIEFSVPQEARVRLTVLDIQGREIAVLADGSYPTGKYQAVWSGETERGVAAPSGVYFLHFQSAAGTSLTQRVVLAR